MATHAEVRPEYWDEPRVTANAHLLAGFIAASLGQPYGIEELSNPLVVVNRETGNRFKIHIEQVWGSE